MSFVFEGAAWYFAYKEFARVKGKLSYLQAVSRGKNPLSFVVLFEDSAAMLGLIIAFLGIFLGQVTGIVYFDGLASILIGLILAITAAWLAYETKGLLIGESAGKDVVDGIKELAKDQDIAVKVNEVLTMHIGPEYILANLSIEFEDEANATEIETAISRLDKQIKERFPNVKRVFVEAEQRA